METQQTTQDNTTEIRYYIKKYGIIKDKWNIGFNLLIDGRETELNFKNKEFALKKADLFIKKCYKDFIDFQDKQVIFNYVCIGEIKREDFDNRFKLNTENNFK